MSGYAYLLPAIQVHKTLGPGLLESVYQQCMHIELQRRSLRVEVGRRVTIEYAGHRLPNALVIDLLVEGQVIVELKSVQALHPIHSVQVMTYLRLSGCPAALLINFNAPTVNQGLTRLIIRIVMFDRVESDQTRETLRPKIVTSFVLLNLLDLLLRRHADGVD